MNKYNVSIKDIVNSRGFHPMLQFNNLNEDPFLFLGKDFSLYQIDQNTLEVKLLEVSFEKIISTQTEFNLKPLQVSNIVSDKKGVFYIWSQSASKGMLWKYDTENKLELLYSTEIQMNVIVSQLVLQENNDLWVVLKHAKKEETYYELKSFDTISNQVINLTSHNRLGVEIIELLSFHSGKCIFLGFTSTHGQEIWSYSKENGLKQMKDIHKGSLGLQKARASVEADLFFLDVLYQNQKGENQFSFWSWDGSNEPILILSELNDSYNYKILPFGNGSIVNYSHYASRGWVNPELEYIEKGKATTILQPSGGPGNTIHTTIINQKTVVIDLVSHNQSGILRWQKNNGLKTIVKINNSQQWNDQKLAHLSESPFFLISKGNQSKNNGSSKLWEFWDCQMINTHKINGIQNFKIDKILQTFSIAEDSKWLIVYQSGLQTRTAIITMEN